ncbi:MAG: ribulose-phosphate 3-epimerase [Bacteroidales bacterium]|jgi:ribulose-phosphate 3-epimerase|nr:ribulose-phosphate 3-epimerase [Bacteroidales bacterium]MCI2121893.1 ribulose-phosphate 3-epimerase [Bacteroidales bacterium]MCI2145665.1 ribulose-phosphate 3-epimerase [Bacteroidales bacterium]
MAEVSPSLLSADFGNLRRDVGMLNSSECSYIHLDIMDGIFVPNISFGIPVIKSVASYARKPLDVHLMIVKPENWVDRMADLGVRILTVHYEACVHLHRTIQAIHSRGMLAGVAVNPSTPVSVLEDIAGCCDLILMMSVNPGFGGQSFIEHSLEKAVRLKKMLSGCGSNARIEVDGGVSLANRDSLIDAGVDILVAGSAVFSAEDPVEAIRLLKRGK